jgi:hypothetical protein
MESAKYSMKGEQYLPNRNASFRIFEKLIKSFKKNNKRQIFFEANIGASLKKLKHGREKVRTERQNH